MGIKKRHDNASDMDTSLILITMEIVGLSFDETK